MLGLAPGLGKRAPPTEIWQRAFDHDHDHLRRLAGLEPDAKPDLMDPLDYSSPRRSSRGLAEAPRIEERPRGARGPPGP